MLQNKDSVKEFLIANQEFILELIKPITDMRQEILIDMAEIFEDDIKVQYHKAIIETIAEEVGRTLAVDCESIRIVLEEIDIDTYLKGV